MKKMQTKLTQTQRDQAVERSKTVHVNKHGFPIYTSANDKLAFVKMMRSK